MSDFSMAEGTTKIIEIPFADETTDSLAGSSLTWGFFDVQKSGSLSGTTYTVRLDPDDTIGKRGDHKYDALITDAQGNVSVAVAGIISITKRR